MVTLRSGQVYPRAAGLASRQASRNKGQSSLPPISEFLSFSLRPGRFTAHFS